MARNVRGLNGFSALFANVSGDDEMTSQTWPTSSHFAWAGGVGRAAARATSRESGSAVARRRRDRRGGGDTRLHPRRARVRSSSHPPRSRSPCHRRHRVIYRRSVRARRERVSGDENFGRRRRRTRKLFFFYRLIKKTKNFEQ